jgi:hypothetical protein
VKWVSRSEAARECAGVCRGVLVCASVCLRGTCCCPLPNLSIISRSAAMSDFAAQVAAILASNSAICFLSSSTSAVLSTPPPSPLFSSSSIS